MKLALAAMMLASASGANTFNYDTDSGTFIIVMVMVTDHHASCGFFKIFFLDLSRLSYFHYAVRFFLCLHVRRSGSCVFCCFGWR